MKNKLISIIILLFLLISSTLTKAQIGEVGLRFMPTFSALNIKTSDGGKIKGNLTIGYGGGILIGYNLSEHFGFQSEIIYSSIAQRYREQDIDHEITLNYINIPLLISLNTGKTKPFNFNVVAGPQISFSVGSDISTSSNNGTTSGEAILAIRKGDVGFAYGAGIDFGINHINTLRMGIGFRNVIGLIDISSDSNNYSNQDYYVLDKNHMKTYAGYIGVSYLF